MKALNDHDIVEPRRGALIRTLDLITEEASNDIEYLLGLTKDALENEEHFESDAERAEWVICQWCQELQFEPDLSEYEAGQTVPCGEQEGRR